MKKPLQFTLSGLKGTLVLEYNKEHIKEQSQIVQEMESRVSVCDEIEETIPTPKTSTGFKTKYFKDSV